MRIKLFYPSPGEIQKALDEMVRDGKIIKKNGRYLPNPENQHEIRQGKADKLNKQ